MNNKTSTNIFKFFDAKLAMKDEKKLIIINYLNLIVLTIILVYTISGISTLGVYEIGLNAIFMFFVIPFILVILYCAYTGKTIKSKGAHLNAAYLTCALGLLLILDPVILLVVVKFGYELIIIMIMYVVLGIISTVFGIKFKDLSN